MPQLRERSRERESMDNEHVQPAVLQAEYRFLARFNRATAAAHALLAAIDHRVRAIDGCVRVADLGSGGADIPRALMQASAGRPWRCECVCVDASASAIAYAHALPHVEGLSYLVSDMLQAPQALGAASVDVAHASLVLHHLEDAAVVQALRAMAQVARQLVVWNDLVRDRAGIIGAGLSTLLARRELRRDAMVSVQRSFTLAEARMLAEAAGLQDIQVGRLRGARFVLTARPGDQTGAPARRPMVRAQGFCFSYGDRQVLRDVSLVARSGECLVVTGANGSGKSTLLACIAGALPADRARLWLDRTHAPPGYLPQEGGLFSALDAGSNIELAARLARVPRPARERMVREIAALLNVQAHLSRPVQALSGGLRRRVALACSAVHRPNVLILDEPDAGLDEAGHAALARLVTQTLAQGGVAVVATHARQWSRNLGREASVHEVPL